MAVLAPMTSDEYKKKYGVEPFSTATISTSNTPTKTGGGFESNVRGAYNATAGDFLKGVARSGQNLGTAVGYGGIKLADKLSGGKVGEYAKQRTGRSIDESLSDTLNQTTQPSSLVPAFNSGQGQGVAVGLKNSVGDSLKNFAYAYGGGNAPGIIANTLKGRMVKGALTGAKVGGVGGAAYGVSEGLQDRSLDSNPTGVLTKGVTSGIVGAAAGTVLGGALPMAGKVFEKLSPSEEGLENIITKKYEKGVKPTIPGKTTPNQLDRYREGVVVSAKAIADNKPNLKFTDELGEAVTGQNPKSLQQFSEAIEQTKKSVFNQYDALAQQAGDKGFSMNLTPIANELDTVINSKALNLANPKAVAYAMGLKNRLTAAGSLDAATSQEVIQTYNKSLEAFYRNPNYDTASQAAVDAMIVNKMRQSLDEGVSKLTGSQYGELKRTYGALKAVERDVIRATLRDARKNTKGLIDFSDILSGGQIINGILTMNPAVIAQGVAQKSIASYYKFLNNPNRAIEKMFNATDDLQRLSQSKTSGNSQFKKNPNAVNPTTANKNDIPPIVPNDTNKVKGVPNKKEMSLEEAKTKFDKKLREISPNQPESWYKAQMELQPFVKDPKKFGLNDLPNKEGGFSSGKAVALGAGGTVGLGVAGEIHKANKFIDKDLAEVKESKEQPTTTVEKAPEAPKETLVRPTEVKSKVPEKYIPVLKEATKKGVISANALAALINTENGSWKEDLVNASGTDTGLGQHNDNTYKDINKLFKKNYGREYNRKNGEDNIKATALWMNYLAKQTGGSLKDVVISYRIGVQGLKAMKEGKGTKRFTYEQLKSMGEDKWASFQEFYK